MSLEDRQFTRDSRPIMRGYSGHGPGKNNLAMQAVGPTPLGTYSTGPHHHNAVTGNYSMSLVASGLMAASISGPKVPRT